MGSSFFGLDIAISGLYASQASLNTTAHNIANAERDGYCKQYVTTKAGTPLRSYSTYGMVGTGVEATDILQNRNSVKAFVKIFYLDHVSGPLIKHELCDDKVCKKNKDAGCYDCPCA